MNKQDILNIRLGAKQIPLLFEKDPVNEQEVIGSCVWEFAERYGEIELHQFIQYVKETRRDLTVGTGGPLLKGTTSPKAPNLFKLQINSRPPRGGVD